MNKDVLKELTIKATDIVLKANASTGELGFNTAYIQEQWRYEFAKLVEQATLERASKICEEADIVDVRGSMSYYAQLGYASATKHAIAAEIRALKDSND